MTENDSLQVIDAHCHVGLLGDQCPQWGCMADWFQQELVYRIFLRYVGLDPGNVSDQRLREATERALSQTAKVRHVVCLALDPVYDRNGNPRPDRSPMWVSNDYILDLQRTLGDKVLLGASVHPYAPDFQERVRQYIDEGAVLLKWLPSAQQFDLADEKVGAAIEFLAKAKDGSPLPLLLHVGPEYALESRDPRTSSYDYLSWTFWDELGDRLNPLRGQERWYRPAVQKVHENLRAGLRAGAVIIFAHCGLPYYTPKLLAGFAEHSDLAHVRRYLRDFPADGSAGGRCFADVSALATPIRKSYFDDIKKLPPGSLIFGSDFPTPVVELYADAQERRKDFRAMLKGDLSRIIIPQDNLLDVNYLALAHHFDGHPMFTNFQQLL